jgi:serine O-acetyltransferase
MIREDFRVKLQYKDKRTKSRSLAFLKVILDPEFWVVVIFRLSNFFYRKKIFPVAKVFWLTNRIVFSVDIDPRANLAGGLNLVHGFCIVIGHQVKSLGPLRIYQGATLGGNSGLKDKINGVVTGQPVILPNVTVGINSCVLGPVLVGENATIGTGAIVTKNVPSAATVVGVNKIVSDYK